MTIQRMDHVGVVVDDLEAAVAYFVELGMEVQGDGSDRPSRDRGSTTSSGLEGVRVEIALCGRRTATADSS